MKTSTTTLMKALELHKVELLEKLQAVETAHEAVKTELQEVKETLAKADKRLAVVEAAPAQVGQPVSPVEKALGSIKKGAKGVTADALSKAVSILEDEGLLSGGDQVKARKLLAQAAMPRA